MTNLLKKIGKKALLPLALTSLLSFSNIQKSKAFDWHWLINPYWQSEAVVPVNLNYYGSGDVNNDGVVNSEDVDRIQDLGFFGSSVPNPEPSLDSDYDVQYNGEISKKHDRADVNGDGVINDDDLNLLEEYVNTGDKSLIPALHWKDLTKQEKKSWAEKVIEIDRTDEISGVSGEFECGHFSFQTQLNTKGVRFAQQHPGDNWYTGESLKHHRRFNIPFYDIVTDSPSWDAAHGINGILIGDNPMDFNDWYFVEPQNDMEAEPGKEAWSGFSSIPNNGYLKVYYDYGYDSTTQSHSQTNFLEWDIENGDTELSSHKNIERFVTKNPKYDTIRPDFNSNIQNNSYHDSFKDFIYTISDSSPKDSCNFLDTLWHKKMSDNKYYVNLGVSRETHVYPPKKSHTDTLDIPETEGEHQVEVYAKDIAGNLTHKVINWVVDVSLPGYSINSPENNEYYSNKPVNDFSVLDAVSGIDTANSYIKLNGNKINWENSQGDTLDVSEGENTLEYYFVDKSGNSVSETKDFVYDITFPNILLEKPQEDTINSSPETLQWNITEANPDEMWYKINGNKTLISNKQGSANMDLNEGWNVYEIYVKDKTGKESSVLDSVFFTGNSPVVNLNSPVFGEKYDSLSIPLDIQITEENLDSANSYIKLNGNKKYINEINWNESLNVNQGQNTFSYYLVDKFGNEALDSGNFEIDTTSNSINKTPFADYSVKAYPNPTQGNFNIKYNFQTPQDASISIYNTAGQNLEQKLIQDDAKGISKFNITGPKGIYIYKIETENGYEDSGKIIKK